MTTIDIDIHKPYQEWTYLTTCQTLEEARELSQELLAYHDADDGYIIMTIEPEVTIITSSGLRRI